MVNRCTLAPVAVASAIAKLPWILYDRDTGVVGGGVVGGVVGGVDGGVPGLDARSAVAAAPTLIRPYVELVVRSTLSVLFINDWAIVEPDNVKFWPHSRANAPAT